MINYNHHVVDMVDSNHILSIKKYIIKSKPYIKTENQIKIVPFK